METRRRQLAQATDEDQRQQLTNQIGEIEAYVKEMTPLTYAQADGTRSRSVIKRRAARSSVSSVLQKQKRT